MKTFPALGLSVLLLSLTGCEATRTAKPTAWETGPLDRHPVPRIQIPPVYPYDMYKQGITGEVVLEYTVNANGDVVDPVVVSATNRAFEAPALDCIIRWKYTPGMKGGRAVNVHLQQPIVFQF